MYSKPMPLDRKLKDDIAVNYHNTLEIPDLFGVEVELEGKKIKTMKPEVHLLWAQHGDNSLRAKKEGDEATEYVLRQPMDYGGTMEAIQALFGHLNSPGVEVYDSYRTSIHVHVSCVLETHRTIYNFMTLAVLFDELLTSQNGRHRAGNNFCLRSKDAQGQVEDVIFSTEQNGSFLGLDANKRYSSINFVSLLKFGTIEFRSLECTTDFGRVKHWIDTLARLKKVARAYENPQAIIREFSLMSHSDFLEMVLGPQADKYRATKGWDTMLQQGMRLGQDLAYCSNWQIMKAGEKYAGVKKKLKYNEIFNPAQPAQYEEAPPPNWNPQFVHGLAGAAPQPMPVEQVQVFNWDIGDDD